MKFYFVLLTVLCLLAAPGLADLPGISLPRELSVAGNGLNALSFVVRLSGVSPESEGGLRYSFEGFPAENPPSFDIGSKLFFWRPRPEQVGPHKFRFVVKDPTGAASSESVVINVYEAASLEALPRGWGDMKKEDRYLRGRGLFPSANIIEVKIGALPEYEIEVRVTGSMSEECVLKYVPGEGKAEVNKGQGTARIKVGGAYLSEKARQFRRDLYEDLFNTLGFVFKRIDSVKVSGGYVLEDLRIYDGASLVSAAGADKIQLPAINISFDDRYYLDTLYSKSDPIRISDTPVIKIDFITSSGLIWRGSRLFINKDEYSAARGEFSVVAVKPYQDASTFDVDYAMYVLRIPYEKKLPFGEHVLRFEMENAYGMAVSREVYARVVSLPTQLEGKVLLHPSPFSPVRDREVKIQYTLSLQANIELAIFKIDGTMVSKQSFGIGEEGGKKGLNTVTWDGRSPYGGHVASGIYTGILIDKGENRILEKFKIAVYQ
jgi:hypothetical protein